MKITPEIVEKEILKWRVLLNLEHWEFTVKYNTDESDNYATVDSDPAYLKADLTFYLANFKDKATLRRKLIHELLHIQLSQYAETAIVFAGSKKKILLDLEERLATEMERWEVWSHIK